MTTTQGMQMNAQGNLFEELQRKAKLTSARPHQIQLINQKHAHIQKLLQQQSDQVNLLQFSTPQQNKNPFIPSPQTINAKGGTKLEQINQLNSQASRPALRVDKLRQQIGNQRAIIGNKKQYSGGSSVLVQYGQEDEDPNKVCEDQVIQNLVHQQIGAYGVVDNATIFTSNNQNRQIRVLSKKQVKQMHYSYQPVLSNQLIQSNPNGTMTAIQINHQQQLSNSMTNGIPNQISLKQPIPEKQTPSQRQIEVLRQLQGAQQVAQSNLISSTSPFTESSKISNNQNQLNQSYKSQVNKSDQYSPQVKKSKQNRSINRQLSPTGRESIASQKQNGVVPTFTNSGLEYLANIANIAQTSPQYVLDKNAIKAEIVNQAALAARNTAKPTIVKAQSNINEANQKLDQIIYDNMMLGSHLSQNHNLPQQTLQNAHQRYDQQEKLIRAFRNVVASGNVDQLSGLEMLKRWQFLYGQAQSDGNNYRHRNIARFDPYRCATGALRTNSTDCSYQNFGQNQSQAESLMQNIKISQLNQISAVLDQQTAKLIQHTQKLMSNNNPLNAEAFAQGVLTTDEVSEFQKVQQDVMATMQQYRPGARYRSSYSGIHQKHYDRQRMLDFYSSIRMGDIDDQAKLRSQAIKQAPPLDPNKLRYSVLNGNNSRLIKIAMARRKDFWLETTNSDPHFHFKWQPISHGIKFEIIGKDIAPEVHPCQKQIVNHFENHGCISEKSKLFMNLSDYTSKKLNENVFDFLPLTFFVECDLSKQKQYSKSMVQFMNAFYALDDIKKRTKKFYQKLDNDHYSIGNNNDGIISEQIDNGSQDAIQPVATQNVKDQLFDDNFIFKHFYQNKILLIRQHKKEEREEKEAYMEALAVTAQHQSNTKSTKRFDVTASTQNQNKQINIQHNRATTQEFQNNESQDNLINFESKSPHTTMTMQKQTQNKMLKKYFHRQSMPFCHYSGHNLWILKATRLNQGQGIHVCNSLPQVKTLIQRYCEGFPKKYLENFTYEKEIQNNKKQTKPNEINKSNTNNNGNLKSNATSPVQNETNKISKDNTGDQKSEQNQQLQLDDNIDCQESPLIREGTFMKKKHFTNSKLSYSVPASKATASSGKKMGSLIMKKDSQSGNNQNQTTQQSQDDGLMDNVTEFENNKKSDDEDKMNQMRKKDCQTPRADSRIRNNRGMLSPKQNQTVFGALDFENQKPIEKHRHLNSTMPEYLQAINHQKPFNSSEPKYKHNSFIIQKYIERPLLIDQRKFDIRVWVFLDSKGNAYICKPGYLRTSSYKFELDPDDPDNRFVHLTNIAVQKYSADFGAHEDGNILNFEQFEQYVHKTWPEKKFQLERDLVFKIRQQIARTLFATRKLMDQNKRINQTFQNSNFFELFGYDFMIDEDFNVWLIECNTNPSLAESAKYLEKLIPRMIEDMVKLTIDDEYMYYYKQIIQVNKQLIAQTEDPSELPDDLADQSCLDNLVNIKSPHLPGYRDDENVWEKMLNLNNRQQRKEAKLKYNQAIEIKSKYAFNIKNRDFKIKKYINYRSQLEQAMSTVAATNSLKKHGSSHSVAKNSSSPINKDQSNQYQDTK